MAVAYVNLSFRPPPISHRVLIGRTLLGVGDGTGIRATQRRFQLVQLRLIVVVVLARQTMANASLVGVCAA